jgi:hypothetical protein
MQQIFYFFERGKKNNLQAATTLASEHLINCVVILHQFGKHHTTSLEESAESPPLLVGADTSL